MHIPCPWCFLHTLKIKKNGMGPTWFFHALFFLSFLKKTMHVCIMMSMHFFSSLSLSCLGFSPLPGSSLHAIHYGTELLRWRWRIRSIEIITSLSISIRWCRYFRAARRLRSEMYGRRTLKTCSLSLVEDLFALTTFPWVQSSLVLLISLLVFSLLPMATTTSLSRPTLTSWSLSSSALLSPLLIALSLPLLGYNLSYGLMKMNPLHEEKDGDVSIVLQWS